jgi:CubicO group peptidase (beta-lactamase class C family)
MYPKADWISFFLSLPKAAAPGTQTFYCTAGVVTLGRIVSESSKMSIQDYSTRNLFAPLGITNSRWATFDSGRQTDTGGHLYLRPRDMAKIGQLVLQGGKWNGAQLVSQEWITKSTSQHTIIDGNRKYGYLWWLDSYKVGSKTYNAHMARGNGGQYIIVVPELDMVVVFTGENYNSPAQQRPFEVLVNYILPAVG